MHRAKPIPVGILAAVLLAAAFLAAQAARANTITPVDDTGFVGRHTSIAVGADGFPVIAYYDVAGEFTSIAVGADGPAS